MQVAQEATKVTKRVFEPPYLRLTDVPIDKAHDIGGVVELVEGVSIARLGWPPAFSSNVPGLREKRRGPEDQTPSAKVAAARCLHSIGCGPIQGISWCGAHAHLAQYSGSCEGMILTPIWASNLNQLMFCMVAGTSEAIAGAMNFSMLSSMYSASAQ